MYYYVFIMFFYVFNWELTWRYILCVSLCISRYILCLGAYNRKLFPGLPGHRSLFWQECNFWNYVWQSITDRGFCRRYSEPALQIRVWGIPYGKKAQMTFAVVGSFHSLNSLLTDGLPRSWHHKTASALYKSSKLPGFFYSVRSHPHMSPYVSSSTAVFYFRVAFFPERPLVALCWMHRWVTDLGRCTFRAVYPIWLCVMIRNHYIEI